jgi:5-methylcytosine-specific restriction endonuclease McrA
MGINVKQYMADHQKDENADALWFHFKKVIEWAQSTFIGYYREMKGLNWGQLYDSYGQQTYVPEIVSNQVQKLLADPYVNNPKGIFEYILGGSIDTKLLDVRVFDDTTKKSIYSLQTNNAKAKGISNCHHCSIGHDANNKKIWELSEMDADHVAAWSKGGATSAKNCQMLCKTHNRAKGNR